MIDNGNDVTIRFSLLCFFRERSSRDISLLNLCGLILTNFCEFLIKFLLVFRYVVYDKLRHRQCQVSDLVLGNSYYFRVKAFNEVGAGEPNGTKDCANIPKESNDTYKSIISKSIKIQSIFLGRNCIQETRVRSYGLPHKTGIYPVAEQPKNCRELQRNAKLLAQMQPETENQMV